MGRKVVIDQDECIGCGSCQEICPEVFKLNEEIEKSEVIKPEGGPEDLIEGVGPGAKLRSVGFSNDDGAVGFQLLYQVIGAIGFVVCKEGRAVSCPHPCDVFQIFHSNGQSIQKAGWWIVLGVSN